MPSNPSCRRSLRLLACLTALVPVSTLSAHAQDTSFRLGTIFLWSDEGGLGFGSTAPSASRTGEAIKDLPAAVDVVDTATMAERGLHSIQEAITRTAVGVTSVSAPVFGTAYALRGFQGNSSVMQVYDGTRLFPGRGNITWPLDSWLAESVEVLHGAGSVIHGSGAIGGTVNVVPKRPFDGAPVHMATVLTGSDGRLRFGLDSGGSLGDRLSYRIATVTDSSDGWIEGADDSLSAVTASLAWKATETLTFTLGGDFGRQKPAAYFGTPLRDGLVVAGTEGLNYNVSDARNTFTDRWVQLRADWTPSDSVKLSTVLYGIGATRDFRNAETYMWDSATDTVTVDEFMAIGQKQKQRGLRTELSFDHGFAGRTSRSVIGFDVNRAESDFASALSFGAIVVDPFAPAPGAFPGGAPVPQYHSTLDQKSVFFENSTDLAPDLKLNLGLRYDWMDVTRTGTSAFAADYKGASARLGLSWAMDHATNVYGQIAWATDPVNMPLLDYMPNMADFKLTTGRQVEAGIKQSLLDGRAEWSLAVFDIVKRNVPVVIPGVPLALVQAGRQSSRGVEISSSLKAGDSLRIHGNAAFTRARFDDFTSIDWNTFSVVDYSGKVPLLVPEVSANLWASWDFTPGWTGHLGVHFVGDSYYDYANTVKRDGFALVNAGLDWSVAEETMLSLRVTNLFDKTYASWLRTDMDGSAQAILGQPRRFELQLTTRF